MTNAKTKYIRVAHIIKDCETGTVVFEGKTKGSISINAAKRESRRLQLQENNRLGLGAVQIAR